MRTAIALGLALLASPALADEGATALFLMARDCGAPVKIAPWALDSDFLAAQSANYAAQAVWRKRDYPEAFAKACAITAATIAREGANLGLSR